MSLTDEIVQSLRTFQDVCGVGAERKGFHDDRPAGGPELANWQGNKLLLIVSEVIEAHDEIRSGQDAAHTYYLKGEKPEGVPSEIADVVIRCFDFAFTEGIDLAGILKEKLTFNSTRERLHGKAF